MCTLDFMRFSKPKRAVPHDDTDETTPVTESVADDVRVGVGDEWIRKVITEVRPFTMTSPERIYGLCLAVEYVVRQKIPGAIVECGVWRGGSAMAIARSLEHAGDPGRSIVLFDTFSGMTPPEEIDRDLTGVSAASLLEEQDRASSHVWAQASLGEVKQNMSVTGYEHVDYVEGDVLETLPIHAPAEIALLRLDTDWHESTKHEMVHLFPRIARGGVLIIDDYGHWSGARQAVDDYLDDTSTSLFLCPLDYTGRLAIVR
jgi:O-methyltransferase